MQVQWTRRALLVVERVCLFLALYDRRTAISLATRLENAAARLLAHPRLGERVNSYAVKEVRKLSLGHYVMHYEIVGDDILILRVWHAREERR
jgi:plasmid stabilization system protein ParE